MKIYNNNIVIKLKYVKMIIDLNAEFQNDSDISLISIILLIHFFPAFFAFLAAFLAALLAALLADFLPVFPAF